MGRRYQLPYPHILHSDPALAKYRFALIAIHPLSWIQRLHLIKIRERLTGLRSRNCPTWVRQHWQYTILTAPSKRMNHAHLTMLRRMCHFHSADLQPQGLIKLQFWDRLCIRTCGVPPLIMTRFRHQVCRLVADLGPPTEPRHGGLQTLVHAFRVQGSNVLGGTQPTLVFDLEDKAIQPLTTHPVRAGRELKHSWSWETVKYWGGMSFGPAVIELGGSCLYLGGWLRLCPITLVHYKL